MKTFESKITVYEKDLDSFGHVNNAVYMEFYEKARWQFITDNGYGLKEVQTLKIGPVILECSIKFRKELKIRETFTVVSKMKQIRGKIMTLHQEMVKEDGSLASEAEFVIGLFDLKARKLIDPTPEWLNAIGVES